jgi:hypothetical protein
MFHPDKLQILPAGKDDHEAQQMLKGLANLEDLVNRSLPYDCTEASALNLA